VGALRAGNPEVFAAGGEAPGLRDRAAVEAVTAAASDPDPTLRRVAMELLAGLAGGEAGPAVLRGLRDEDPMVRAAAARGAGGEALADVARLASDPDAGVRLAAVGALATADLPPDRAEILRAALADPDHRVRARAAGALLGTEHRDEARQSLESMSRSDAPEDRAVAVSALAAEGDVDAVARGLADPDPAVRRATVATVPGTTPPGASEALIDALADPDPDVGVGAAEALVRMG